MALDWAWTLCFMLAFIHSAVAREIVVGGKHGWAVPSGAEPQTYTKWAGRNRFLINDTLLFNYNPAEDSVLEVTAQHYDTCNTSSPIASYKGGNTVFRLPRQGPFHFISGNRSNCQKGEKLIVVVLAPRKGSHGALTPPVASPGPSVVAPSPSFSSAPAPAPAPTPTPTHEVPSSSPSPAPVAPLPSPSSSPSPGPVAPLPSPSSSPSPGPVIAVSSPSSSPTPAVPVLSPSSSSPSTSGKAPTASSPAPATSASTPPLFSALNLVMPLLFLGLKTLATSY